MQKHVKIYRKYFQYGEQSYVGCEICNSPAADVHHIQYRSRGGGDNIENLMALCRYHHDKAHREELSEAYLQKMHQRFIDKFKNNS